MKRKSILFALLVVVSFVFTIKVNAASISCTPTSVYVGDQVTCTISDVGDDEQVTVTTSLSRVSGKTTITKDDVDNGDNNIVYSAKSTGTYKVIAETNNWTSDPISISVSEKTTTTTTTTTKAKSSNAYLSSITIDGSEISDFSKSTSKYYVEVENDVTKISISATAEESSSTVEIDGPTSLEVGENEYTITVTAEDDTTKYYKVYVTRNDEEEDTSSSTKIKSIKIKGYSLDFNSSSKTFYLTIDKDDTELDITVTLSDENSTYEIEGNEDLEDGSIIKIIVTSEDGDTATYRIIIQKSDNNYVPIIAIATILVIIIAIIVFIIIKKKKNKNKTNKNNKGKKKDSKSNNKKVSVETYDEEDDEKTKKMPPISSDNDIADTDVVSDDDTDDIIHVDNDEEEATRILSYAEKEELKRLKEENELKNKLDERFGDTMLFSNDDE